MRARLITIPSFLAVKKALSVLLGCLMLTFGLLKVVSPTIDGWFTVQIQQSHLPHAAIVMGKLGEIVTGLLFLLPRVHAWPGRWSHRMVWLACSSLFLEMLIATYVHLQPGVPADVLPLGIKPPVIPLVVLVLDVIVAVPAAALADGGPSARPAGRSGRSWYYRGS